MKKILFFALSLLLFTACHQGGNSRLEQHRADKHVRDSVALEEQQRSLAYYQSVLDSLMPQADSLIALFKYEKNDQYQDRGNYVLVNPNKGLRILVRDDGKSLLVYKEGQRLEQSVISSQYADDPKVNLAEHLQITIRDIKELEKRIAKTSLEIQKYEKRLTNERVKE